MKVLITGSSKGLGEALAMEFAVEGYGVIIHGRDWGRIDKVVESMGSAVLASVGGDFRDSVTIGRLLRISKEMDVDVLVNNAAIYSNKSVTDLSEQEIKAVMDVNFIAPVLLTKGVFEHFKARGGGRIVNINSIAGLQAKDGESIYRASKHALRGFMQSFEYEAMKHNVYIMNFYLGAMETDMIRGCRDDLDKCMDVSEVAEYIVKSLQINYYRMRVSEVQILRRKY